MASLLNSNDAVFEDRFNGLGSILHQMLVTAKPFNIVPLLTKGFFEERQMPFMDGFPEACCHR